MMIASMALSIIIALMTFYNRSIKAVEVGEAEDAVSRLKYLVDEDIRQLDILCRDWAFWDDSYDFSAGTKEDFLETNLDRGKTVEMLELSGMLIQASDGKRLYGYEQRVGLLDRILASMSPFESLFPESRTGLVSTGDEIHLVSIRPILRSDLSGQPHGFIAMARNLDKSRLDHYSRIVGRISVVRPAEPTEATGAAEEARGHITIDFRDKETLASQIVAELDGRGVAVLLTAAPTVISRYGTTRLLSLSVIVLVIIIASGTAFVLMLEGILLGRMRSIGKDLNRIAAGDDWKARISVTGDDELTVLCSAMNGSLDRLDSMLDEREAMLHEIHHRVRNNLQLIASMLSLQSTAATSEETIVALERSRNRIMALAIVHDEILDRPTIYRIELRGLFERIASSLTLADAVAQRPSFLFEGEIVEVDMDTALPLAMIVEEVLYNAHRHAFAGGTPGEITIGIRRDMASTLFIEIRDNGIGLPKTASRNRGIGLSLVEALCLQLRGRHSLSGAPEGGTVFRLEVPL